MPYFILVILMFGSYRGEAQMANEATVTVKVYGNCGMCKKRIEKAAFEKGISEATWNKDTKMAVIRFDSLKTNADKILKKIAAVGHDSDKFRAKDKVYDSLHACCHYDRPE